jgi:putative hydrolase of the HAD superfamily
MEEAVNSRVNDFIADYLKMPREESWALRKERVSVCGYGVTLEWLMAEHGLGGEEMEKFYAYIHPEDEAELLSPDPSLRTFLLSLKIPIGILTNAPIEHAQRVMKKLKIEDIFNTIYDIRMTDFKGKPNAGIYRRILEELGVTAPSCILVDDVPRYAKGFMDIGGIGILFDEDDRHPEYSGYRIQKLEDLLKLNWPDGSPLLPAAANGH